MSPDERRAWEAREMLRMLVDAVRQYRRHEFSGPLEPARITASAGLSEVEEMAATFLRNTMEPAR